METFGSTLKRERELRKISLQEIAEVTHIRLRYLEAIEHDQFEKLPGLTFLKGYVRSYSQYLGLNTDEVLLHLEEFIAARESPPLAYPFYLKRNVWLWLGVGLGLILLFLFWRA